MDKKLLRSIMALHNETNRNLADLLGITEQSVSAKINESGTEFKQSEIFRISRHYNLTPEQINQIFFAK